VRRLVTSQYFANHYLSPFDHRFKECLRARRYIRYMDDTLVFSSDRDELKHLYRERCSSKRRVSCVPWKRLFRFPNIEWPALLVNALVSNGAGLFSFSQNYR